MRCHNCSTENPQGARFCIQCADPLRRLCQKCRCESPPEARFCAQCAAPLDAVIPVRAEAEAIEGPTGERRHLTVLFCDLVGSTAIAAQLDPEEWRDIVASYHRAAAEAITRFGGHVAQYLGDGVMAYFGWPEAHDNDAERAARAGLAILDAMPKLYDQPTQLKLSVRVGIDSGLVVVGAGVGKEADVFGDAPNIAARVQNAADAGTVMITDATHRLVSGLFVIEDRGMRPLKGIERPVQFYRVIRPSGVRGRLEAAATSRGLTPFVGREDELRLLVNRWERALEGEGQVGLIIGEAGIGKSRVLQRFHEQITGKPHTWVEAAASPFHQNTPFYPVAELLRQFLCGNWGKPAEEQLAQLEPHLALAGLQPAETIPLIAPLLNLRLTDEYPRLALSPERQRRRLLAILVEWVVGASRIQPLVVATEDLHWADASTLELIQLLVEQGATARLLLLYTARPEFRPRWPLRAYHTQINLNRLSAHNARRMVEEVAAQTSSGSQRNPKWSEAKRADESPTCAAKPLTDDMIATVIERTGGVPLFVEELTRAVLERGVGGLNGHEIPVTLNDSLMARLDRLGPAKEVAQLAAIIGTEFSYELLHAVSSAPEAELQAALAKLADAELIYVRGIAPDATYMFKHALIRDAAYEALLRSRRKDLHRLVARTINENFTELRDVHPEILARQWTDAGEIEPAIAEWSRAGKVAEARGAFEEVLESYKRALAMVNLMPESPERDLRELRLREAVFLTLWMTRGPSSDETTDAMQCATALAEKSGQLASLVGLTVTAGMSASVTSRDMDAILTLADQALKLAVREGSAPSLLLAHSLQMQAQLRRGELASAEKHFAAEMELSDDPSIRQNYSPMLVQDFGIATMVAWLIGRFDLARQRFANMIAATNANNPYEVAISRLWAAEFKFTLREYEQAEASATQALELAKRHQFPLIAAISKCSLGKVRTALGRTTEGVELLRQGIADALEMGLLPRGAFDKTWLALAQESEGTIVEALETIEQALQEPTNKSPMRFKVRGELRMKQGQSELAEADFREALALARNIGAKYWELQTIMSLARLLASQGRREEARRMLAEIYDWFTEGFDTADLKDAKALLAELSGS